MYTCSKYDISRQVCFCIKQQQQLTSRFFELPAMCVTVADCRWPIP